MSIRKKIIFAMMLAVLLTIGGVSAVVSIKLNDAFISNYQVNSKAQLDRMDAFVTSFFADATSGIELLAVSPVVVDNVDHISVYLDRKEDYKPVGADFTEPELTLYRTLERTQKAYPAYFLVYVASNAGGITQAPDDILTVGYNPAKRPWYLDTVKAGKSILTEAYISDSGVAVCTVATPVRKNGRIVAAAAVDFSLETLTRETGSVSVGKTGYVLMLDSQDQVVSDPRNSGDNIPESQRWLGKTVSDLPKDAAEALQKLSRLGQGFEAVTIGDKDWLASIKTTRDGWKLIMLQEKDEVFANALDVTMGIVLIGLVIAVVMFIIAWFVSRSISKPVAALAEASHRVAEGDLSAIPRDGKRFAGELGVLHQSLIRMITKLGELIETANSKMKEAEEALAQSHCSFQEAEEAKKMAEQARREGILQTAERLGSVVDQLTQAADRLARASGQIGERSNEQRDRVAGTAGAVEHASSAVQGVNNSTLRAAQLADDTRGVAASGKRLVSDVVRRMGEIEEQSRAISGSMSSLGTQANDIGKIMGMINDIADQTNLLALNAAIEAARAGDAGRGFAVVADEVRKLAEKTMEATKQVAQAIQTIQHSTADNVEAMGRAAEVIVQSVEVAHQAEEALNGIEKMIDNTAAEVRGMADLSGEQSQMLEEIRHSTDGINVLADEVAESAETSSREAQELSRLSHQLGAIVADLRKG